MSKPIVTVLIGSGWALFGIVAVAWIAYVIYDGFFR